MANATRKSLPECGEGDHFAEMTDLRPRFVPPRLDL